MRRLATVFIVLSILIGSAGPATAAPVLEKDVNLDESNRLRDILIGQGIEVVMTRTGDTNPALVDRAHLGGEGDLLISVHNNSSGNPSAHGTEVYAQLRNPESMRLAENILSGVVSRAGTTSRGALTRAGERGDYYAILRNSPVPAVIVEGAFLSNPDEAAALASPDFRQRLAEGIADGVLSVIGRAEPLGDGPPPAKTLLGGHLVGAPNGLTVARAGSGAHVSWSGVPFAGGYEVWKDGALAGVVAGQAFDDPDLGPGRHRYDVRAFIGVGALLDQSPTATVETGGARVVIDPGHGGVDSGAVGDA